MTPQTLVVAGVTHVKGRGSVIIVTLTGPEPAPSTKVVRLSDGAFWFVAAVEWFAIGRRPGRGDKVGLLLHARTRRSDGMNPDPEPLLGDVVRLQEEIP